MARNNFEADEAFKGNCKLIKAKFQIIYRIVEKIIA